MPVDKEIKKKIAKDWLKAFPQLTMYALNRFYKIAGPIIFGLELIRLPFTEEYSPHFVMYSLWGNSTGNDLKSCLAYPIILKEYYNIKGFQYSIPYNKQNSFNGEIIESISKQTPLTFEGNISLSKLISVIEEYSKTPPLSAAPNSYLQALLQEAKLKIALFAGDTEALKVLEQINKRIWDKNHFEACGVDIKKWLQELQKTIANRNEFLKQIENNKREKKIVKFKVSELTGL